MQSTRSVTKHTASRLNRADCALLDICVSTLMFEDDDGTEPRGERSTPAEPGE
jgi:hypothetical protein